MKKVRNIVASFLVTVLMLVSSIPVLAAPMPEETVNEVKINFDVALETNVKGVFPNYDFEFVMLADDNNPSVVVQEPDLNLDSDPNSGTKNVVEGYGNAMDLESSEDLSRTRTGEWTLRFPDTTRVGEYKYTLKQATTGQTGMTYDTKEYLVSVIIVNQVDDETCELTGKTTIGSITIIETENGGKVGQIINVTTDDSTINLENAFTNKYASAGVVDPENPDATISALTISKTVSGIAADTEQYFAFTVSVNDANMTGTQEFSFVGGTYPENPTTIQNGEKTTIYLKHDEVIGIQGLSTDTEYVITALGVKEHMPSYTINDDHKTGGGTEEFIGQDLEANHDSLLDSGEIVAFHNQCTGKPIPETGMFMSLLPFIIIGGLAVAIITVNKASKHKMNK